MPDCKELNHNAIMNIFNMRNFNIELSILYTLEKNKNICILKVQYDSNPENYIMSLF